MSDFTDYDWDELPTDAKAAAEIIGYTPEIWAVDGDTSLSEKSWSELTADQKAAAAVLGYDEEEWDEEE